VIPPHPRRSFFGFRLSLIEILVVVSITGVLVGLMLPAGNGDRQHRYPPPSPNATESLASVAGDYYQGDGLGLNWELSILADGRYSFIWSGCCGVYERESGGAKEILGLLVLRPTKPIESRMARVFHSVRWGPRTYLIPPEKMEEFCDAIITGKEPRNDAHGRFYLPGELSEVDGIPELPEKWATYLHKNLLISTVAQLLKDRHVKIDLGIDDGIYVGDSLRVQGSGNRPPRELRVTRAEKQSCIAEETFPGEFKEELKPGWKVVAPRNAR
jgi:hypothetical protein